MHSLRGRSNLRLFIIVALLHLVSVTDVHGRALHALLLWCADNGRFHLHELARMIDENRRGQLDDAWD